MKWYTDKKDSKDRISIISFESSSDSSVEEENKPEDHEIVYPDMRKNDAKSSSSESDTSSSSMDEKGNEINTN